jgi:hypothetical protein
VYEAVSDWPNAAAAYLKELAAWKALDPELASHFASDIQSAQAAVRRCQKALSSN